MAQCIFECMQDNFYLFLSQFKNNSSLLALLLQQLSITIMFISRTGRTHSNLTLHSLYFPVYKGSLKADGLVKVGNLSTSIQMKNKEELLEMPIRYQTPPEILNFILFE